MNPNYSKYPGPGDLWGENEEEDFPDVTDDRDDLIDPEDWEVDMRDTSYMDYIYDPLSRKGFE